MAVHLLHAQAEGADGRLIVVNPVIGFGLELDGVFLAYLRQRTGVGNDEAGDSLKVAFRQVVADGALDLICLLYTSPSPRD